MGLWGTWTGSREGLSEMALSMVIDVIDPVRTSRCPPRGRSVYFVTCSAARNMSSPTGHSPVQSGRRCTRPPPTSFVSLGPHSAQFSEQTAMNAFVRC